MKRAIISAGALLIGVAAFFAGCRQEKTAARVESRPVAAVTPTTKLESYAYAAPVSAAGAMQDYAYYPAPQSLSGVLVKAEAAAVQDGPVAVARVADEEIQPAQVLFGGEAETKAGETREEAGVLAMTPPPPPPAEPAQVMVPAKLDEPVRPAQLAVATTTQPEPAATAEVNVKLLAMDMRGAISYLPEADGPELEARSSEFVLPGDLTSRPVAEIMISAAKTEAPQTAYAGDLLAPEIGWVDSHTSAGSGAANFASMF